MSSGSDTVANMLIETAIASAVIVAAAAIVVFIAGEISKWWMARRAIQRQAVLEMVGTVEQWIKENQFPLLLLRPVGSELDLPLALMKLSIDLGRRDAPVARWLAVQLTQFQAARSISEQVRIAAIIAGRLIEWHAGGRKRSWFLRDATSPVKSEKTNASAEVKQRIRKRFSLALVALVAASIWAAWVVRGFPSAKAD